MASLSGTIREAALKGQFDEALRAASKMTVRVVIMSAQIETAHFTVADTTATAD